MFDYAGMGHGFFMPGMMFLWFVIAVIILGFFISNKMVCKNSSNESSCKPQSPLDIAKRRFAEGKVSEEEFDRIKVKIS